MKCFYTKVGVTLCKYKYPDYWKLKVQEGDGWFSSINQIYKPNDLIFIGQIINRQSGQNESIRLLFPDIKAVTGFVQYVYLPTVFIGFLKIDGIDPKMIMVGDESFASVIEALPIREEFDQEVVLKIKKMLSILEASWDSNEAEMSKKLEQVLRILESLTNEHVITAFNVLKSPTRLASWLVTEYESEPVLGIDSLEKEVKMKVDEFIELSKEAESKPFQSKRFFNSLDNVMIL
ncbi:hypothetical protein [Halalkalibacter krulwichiae]|uniref:Uncharacterized protein n=1 Tax=Halalkalibacter krulwichiae TaxID=199441 RepID=A0A1X9M805_9BACI|nr:hypothetical protein [Halalkalibacter krulwichiae]ARK29558.1 hypothetical protein BkAM31D_06610 [Halalkalibacter krulwichiae]